MAAKIFGAAQGISTGPYRDELVKNLIMLYSSKHFEYVSYQVIIAAAKDMGISTVAETCQHIADEEKATAGALIKHRPTVVTEVINSAGTE